MVGKPCKYIAFCVSVYSFDAVEIEKEKEKSYNNNKNECK